jgi:hypothetical protein
MKKLPAVLGTLSKVWHVRNGCVIGLAQDFDISSYYTFRA